MHEQVFVQDIIAAATKHGTVDAITVEVGELAPITRTDLEHALALTGWKLTFAIRPGKVQCACGYLGRPIVTEKGHDYTIFHCPECQALLPRIVDGKDVVLKEVTVR